MIRAAYKALAQKWHPDKHVGTKENAELRFKAISAAYEILSEPVLRAEYDAELKADRQKAEEPKPEAAYSPTPRRDKESIPSQLWSGTAPLWKLIWVYMIGLPLAFICAEVIFLRDPGILEFLSSAVLIVAYQAFMHLCLWRTVRNTHGSRWRKIAKTYCFAVVMSPLWGGAIAGYSNHQQEIERQEWRAEQDRKEFIARQESAARDAARQVAEKDEAQRQAYVTAQLIEERKNIRFDEDGAIANGLYPPVVAFQKALEVVYERYPFLDSSNPSHNDAAIKEALSVTQYWLDKGMPNSNAVLVAAKQVGNKYEAAAHH